MRVLVTGGSGYIGNAVTEAFCRAGHSVAATVTVSGKSRLVERFGARSIVWNLGHFRTLAEEIRDCDVLVHTAMNPGADGGAIDRECVTFFLEALETAKGLRRFLYTSGGLGPGKYPRPESSRQHGPGAVSFGGGLATSRGAAGPGVGRPGPHTPGDPAGSGLWGSRRNHRLFVGQCHTRKGSGGGREWPKPLVSRPSGRSCRPLCPGGGMRSGRHDSQCDRRKLPHGGDGGPGAEPGVGL